MILEYADIVFTVQCNQESIRNQVISFFSNYVKILPESDKSVFSVNCHNESYPENLDSCFREHSIK